MLKNEDKPKAGPISDTEPLNCVVVTDDESSLRAKRQTSPTTHIYISSDPV
jgi:hypothetical protein